eukprot:GHUV01039219.1.p1 GENE.GHUV01039219.1~~GHUV01039219.1.p1  ORF type:complete len:109 (-),score=14.90 GHUV01039219.1:163-489(-)
MCAKRCQNTLCPKATTSCSGCDVSQRLNSLTRRCTSSGRSLRLSCLVTAQLGLSGHGSNHHFSGNWPSCSDSAGNCFTNSLVGRPTSPTVAHCSAMELHQERMCRGPA